MLPPSLHVAAPRILAVTSPHVVAATAITLAPTAYKLALELPGSPKKVNMQPYHHRSFHWWCRRSPSRRYASWGRHNPIDGTEPRAFSEYKTEKDINELELSPREKLWKAKMEMINKMMRTDAYEGLFGSSNRMLKGLHWRDNAWRKMWEEQWKDMEKMHGAMKDEARTMLKAFERDLRYPDSEVAKQATENKKVKDELARVGWEYDAITNKMVQKNNVEKTGTSIPGRVEEKRDDFIEIPVKPYTKRSAGVGESMPGRSEEVRAGFSDIPVKHLRPKVEICNKKDAKPASRTEQSAVDGTPNSGESNFVDKEIGHRFQSTFDWPSSDLPSNTSRRIPIPTVVSEVEPHMESFQKPAKSKLPKDDLDLLTAEDVRARMGHVKQPARESFQQKNERRAALETQFEVLRNGQDEIDLANLKSAQAVKRAAIEARSKQSSTVAESNTTNPAFDEQWRLQREQLKEAVADFQTREQKTRKEIRELQHFHQSISSRLLGLQGRSNGLVRSGSLSPKNAVFLDPTSATLEADMKVLSKASSLIAAAIASAPKLPQTQVPGYVEPSLDRYAWSKKPFARIRDAEELVQNVRDSLRNAEDTVKAAERRLEKSIKMASTLNAEVEKQRLAMRGYEEKWRWRNDDTAAAVAASSNSPAPFDANLAKEIKTIYEDEYGSITTKHRQDTQPPDLTQEEELAAMSLGGIPEISPASFDGGIIAEPAESLNASTHPEAFSGTPSNSAASTTAALPAKESIYTILALDPTTDMITRATTASTAKAEAEEPIPILAALKKVAQPALFANYLPQLHLQGFEPISSSENLIVLKKLHDGRAPELGKHETQVRKGLLDESIFEDFEILPSKQPQSKLASSSEATAEPESRKLEDAELSTGMDADSNAKETYYSTRLQSPTSSTFQGMKPKKVEPVFSGEQGGHSNYERLRRRMREQMRDRKQRRRRTRRRLKRFAGTLITMAAVCYLAGVLSETWRYGTNFADWPPLEPRPTKRVDRD